MIDSIAFQSKMAYTAIFNEGIHQAGVVHTANQ